MTTPQPQAFFSQLVARALAQAKTPPTLADVTPLADRGWRLSFRLADGGPGAVEVNAVEADAPAGYDYAYVPADPEGPRPEHLDRVGHLLCRALGRLRLAGSKPALVVTPSEDELDEHDEREHLSFWLIGDCDRACEFCSVSIQAPESRSLARLPLMADTASASFTTIAAQLQANAARADAFTVEWSGQDCLLSPDFDRGLKLAYDLGYRRMGIQTPGSRLVEPGFVEFLKAHSVVRAGLTAHAGDRETFDRSGGKPGAFDIFWAGLHALLEHDFDVALEVPCTARTVDGLPEHLARLCEFPCPVTCFFWYPSTDMNDTFDRIGMPFARALEALRRAKALVSARRVAIDGIPECVRPGDLLDHYFWGYGGGHMSFIDFQRVDACRSCAAVERCPGAAPVYLEHHAWPGTPVVDG